MSSFSILGTSIASKAAVAGTAGYFAFSGGFVPAITFLATTALSLKTLAPFENFLIKKSVLYFGKIADNLILKRYEDLKNSQECNGCATADKNFLAFHFNIAKVIKVVSAITIGYFAKEAITFTADYLSSSLDLSALFSAAAYVGGMPLVPTVVFATKAVALAALLYKCHQFTRT